MFWFGYNQQFEAQIPIESENNSPFSAQLQENFKKEDEYSQSKILKRNRKGI
jgi:hypothetical protein